MKQIMVFTLVALMCFKDKITKQIIQPGDKLQTDDLTRVNDVVKRGLCEIVSVESPTQKEPKPEENSAEAHNEETETDQVEFQGIKYSLDAVKAALHEIGVSVNANAGVKGVSNKLAALSEDQQKQLQESLKVTE